MLPKEIIRRFLNPGALEKEFINYLEKSKAPINQDKTIATQVLYDARPTGVGETSVTLFTGNYNQAQTNIDTGSYVRPESEHFLIYGIRFYVANDTNDVDQATWLRGEYNQLPSINNSVFSLVCNSVQYLKNVPIDQFNQDLIASENEGRGTLWIDEPILWEGQTELSIQWRTLTQGGIEEEDICIRFDLVGIGLI